MSGRYPPLRERLLARYETNAEGCWIWQGVRVGGYGQIGKENNGGMVYAHRAAYELIVGPIPDGLTLDHLCRNRACINPDHLEPVTMKENVLRGMSPTAINARKTHCNNGHPLDGDNLSLRKDGGRICLACRRVSGARWRAKNPNYFRNRARELDKAVRKRLK